jgi:hypothetical protein
MHFLKCLLVFIFLVRKFIFDILGSKFRFWAMKAYFRPCIVFFLTPCKTPDRWICHTIILGPQILFLGSVGFFSPFYLLKYIFNAPCKIPDRWIYYTTILILGPKFRFWVQKANFHLFDPSKYILLKHQINQSQRTFSQKKYI